MALGRTPVLGGGLAVAAGLVLLLVLNRGETPGAKPSEDREPPALRPNPPEPSAAAPQRRDPLVVLTDESPDPPPRPDGRIRGVIALPAATPDERVELVLLAGGGEVVLRQTVAAGPFDLPWPDRRPPVHLAAHAPERETLQVAVPAGGGDLGEVVLRPAATYGGRILDEHGRPVADAVVELFHLAVLSTSMPSDPAGAFRLFLPARPASGGPHHLRVRARGRAPAEFEIQPAGLAGEHEIRLPPSTDSAVRARLVRAADGGALSGVRWRLTRGGSEVLDGGTTDANGRLLPRWAKERTTAQLEVELDGAVVHRLLARDDVLTADEAENVAVRAPSECLRLALQCVDDRDAPIGDAAIRVLVRTEEGHFFMDDRTDAAGRFTALLDLPSDAAAHAAILGLLQTSGGRVVRWLERGELPVQGGIARLPAPPPDPAWSIAWMRTPGVRTRIESPPEGPAAVGGPAPFATEEVGWWPITLASPREGEASSTETAVEFLVDGRPVAIPLGRLREAAKSGRPISVRAPAAPVRLFRVVDERGAPVARATVLLDPPAGARRSAGFRVLTNRGGHAALPEAAPFGEWRIFAWDPAGDRAGGLGSYSPGDAAEITDIRIAGKAALSRKISSAVPLPPLEVKLEPLSKALSMNDVPGRIADGRLSTPPAFLGLYRLVVREADSPGRPTRWSGPADAVPDPLVLESQ